MGAEQHKGKRRGLQLVAKQRRMDAGSKEHMQWE